LTRAKPSLIAQSITVEYYRQQTKDYFDLMAGYSQYRKQLAAPADTLHRLVIKKTKFVTQVKDLLRQINNGKHET
jgi:hypothetical protein